MAELIYKTVGSINACIQGVSISQIIYTGPTQIMFLGKLREKLTKKNQLAKVLEFEASYNALPPASSDVKSS